MIKQKWFPLIVLVVNLFFTSSFAQQADQARTLLDQVSTKMLSYENMRIDFNTTLSNEEAGIQEGDEAPLEGLIFLQDDRYNLTYMGVNFIFDGNRLYVINHDEEEVAINNGDMEEEEGFIYPSKLFSFYKEGYTFAMGEKKTMQGKKIQYVNLTPINSDSEIVKVQLAVELTSKQIYQLIQYGANTSKTTFTITAFKSNQPLKTELFTFDAKKYPNYSID